VWYTLGSRKLRPQPEAQQIDTFGLFNLGPDR
jgi:hypothetical protein